MNKITKEMLAKCARMDSGGMDHVMDRAVNRDVAVHFLTREASSVSISGMMEKVDAAEPSPHRDIVIEVIEHLSAFEAMMTYN